MGTGSGEGATARGVEGGSAPRYFTQVAPTEQMSVILWRIAMPLGVTGNTSASGAEESRFDPWRGNWNAVLHLGAGPRSSFDGDCLYFAPAAPVAFRSGGSTPIR